MAKRGVPLTWNQVAEIKDKLTRYDGVVGYDDIGKLCNVAATTVRRVRDGHYDHLDPSLNPVEVPLELEANDVSVTLNKMVADAERRFPLEVSFRNEQREHMKRIEEKLDRAYKMDALCVQAIALFAETVTGLLGNPEDEGFSKRIERFRAILKAVQPDVE